MQNKLIEVKQQAAINWPCLTKRYQFKKAKLIFADELESWGLCWLASNTIEINMQCAIADPERTLTEVVGHELCHILTPLLYPGVGFTFEDAHGKEWQAIMKAMSLAIDPIDLIV